MTQPSEHIASARRFVSGCYSVVRVPEGAALYRCRGSYREYVDTYSIYSELVTFLLEDHDEALASAQRESARHAAIARARQAEEDYPLADDFFSLNMDIDL